MNIFGDMLLLYGDIFILMKLWEYVNICIFLYVLYIIVYVLFFNFFVKIKLESFGIMMVIFFVVDGFFEVGWDILLLFFYFFFVKIKFYNIWLFVNIWNYGRDIIRCSWILKKKIILKIEFKLICLFFIMLMNWYYK